MNVKAIKKALKIVCYPTIIFLIFLYLWFLNPILVFKFIKSNDLVPSILRIMIFLTEVFFFLKFYKIYCKEYPEKIKDFTTENFYQFQMIKKKWTSGSSSLSDIFGLNNKSDYKTIIFISKKFPNTWLISTNENIVCNESTE